MNEEALSAKQAILTQHFCSKGMKTTLHCSYVGPIFAFLVSVQYIIWQYYTVLVLNKGIDYKDDVQ